MLNYNIILNMLKLLNCSPLLTLDNDIMMITVIIIIIVTNKFWLCLINIIVILPSSELTKKAVDAKLGLDNIMQGANSLCVFYYCLKELGISFSWISVTSYINLDTKLVKCTIIVSSIQ